MTTGSLKESTPRFMAAGDVYVAPFTVLRHELHVEGRLVVGDGAQLLAAVEATDDVRFGRLVKVTGRVTAGGRFDTGPDCDLNAGYDAAAGAELGAGTRAPPPSEAQIGTVMEVEPHPEEAEDSRVPTLPFALGTLFAFPGRARGREDVVVPPLAVVREDLDIKGTLRVGDGAVLLGRVAAHDGVILGRRVRVAGPVVTDGELRAGRHTALESGFTAGGEVRLEQGVRVAATDSDDAVEDKRRKRVLSGVPLDVPTSQADALLAAFRAVGWDAEDTGIEVSTDSDDETLTTLLLDVLLPARYTTLATPPDEARESTEAPAPTPGASPLAAVRGVVHVAGDLVIGEGVETDLTFSATGRVLVGRGAYVGGLVRAAGDIVLKDAATVGDAMSGGALRLGEGAKVANLLEAAEGVAGPGKKSDDAASSSVRASESAATET